ncbi:MAG: hypothetical protein DI587_03440 [Variovorax paradoxus]|nr:MAG: hypothetical protein DI583_03440 [Variovorax paradoxus]PZQ15136.1 MAG: hypothetical protein DI587_03440 [Variovorax paradoxus]
MQMFHAWALVALCAVGSAMAQTSPAHGPLAAPGGSPASRARELADYLGLLQQIAPAAEGGARTYLAAVQLRCGRSLDVAELRLAMTQDGGDPVLMGLIRATATQDMASRQRWVGQLTCATGAKR